MFAPDLQDTYLVLYREGREENLKQTRKLVIGVERKRMIRFANDPSGLVDHDSGRLLYKEKLIRLLPKGSE